MQNNAFAKLEGDKTLMLKTLGWAIADGLPADLENSSVTAKSPKPKNAETLQMLCSATATEQRKPKKN